MVYRLASSRKDTRAAFLPTQKQFIIIDLLNLTPKRLQIAYFLECHFAHSEDKLWTKS